VTKTTQLFTAGVSVEIMRRAGGTAFRSPGRTPVGLVPMRISARFLLLNISVTEGDPDRIELARAQKKTLSNGYPADAGGL
jgi:hypothetical protein